MSAGAIKQAPRAPEAAPRKARKSPVPDSVRKRIEMKSRQWTAIRGLSEYGEELGMPFAPLRDKRVLDIGAGIGRFGYMARIVLGMDVVSISYSYDSPVLSPEVTGAILTDTYAKVRGFGEALPFRSDSFDAVVSCYGPVYHFKSLYVDESPSVARRGLGRMLRESIRVLRPGGEARMNCERDSIPDIRAAMRSIAARHPEISWEIPIKEAEGYTLKIVKRG